MNRYTCPGDATVSRTVPQRKQNSGSFSAFFAVLVHICHQFENALVIFSKPIDKLN
jgi:hypothetical protein